MPDRMRDRFQPPASADSDPALGSGRLWIPFPNLVRVSRLGARSAEGLSVSSVPKITSEADRRFHDADLVFAIRGIDRPSDKSRRIRATGKAESSLVEFDLILGPDWKKAKLGRILTLYLGTVEIHSVGRTSDELLKALDLVYKTSLHPKLMAPTVKFTAISLQGNPLRPSSGALKLKLFFESEKEGEYAELYLDIEWARARVHLKEKDPYYRVPIVRALSGAAG
jgi:hypothetical protein